jgi:glycosidase
LISQAEYDGSTLTKMANWVLFYMSYVRLCAVIAIMSHWGVCITAADVFHDASSLFYVNPAAGEIKIRGTVGTIASVQVIVDSVRHAMNLAYSSNYDYFAVRISPFDTTTRYAFVIADTADSIRFPETGTITPRAPLFVTPQWARGRTYYSLFTDGFYNADIRNDPAFKLMWGAMPRDWLPYGGDIKGIREKIGYLDSLGVDIVLLQPIFPASSNHKLNPHDLTAIDASFGDTAEFSELIDVLHAHSMRVIMSIVCTHTGLDFPSFTDITEKGAASGYADWYHIRSFPIQTSPPNYECWHGDFRFPKLNLRNDRVRNYITNAIDHWLPFDVDGFYIGPDTLIDQNFVAMLHTHVKQKNPELLLLGSDRRRVSGVGFDGVSLDNVTDAIVDYFINKTITTSAFDEQLQHILFFNPPQVTNNNLIALSANTCRIAQTARRDALSNLYAFLFTFVGSPVILYGDEIGMTDCVPYNPGSFSWAAQDRDQELLAEIRQLITIRTEHPQIRGSAFFTLYVNDITQVYAYDRGGIVVVLNSGDKTAFVELPAWDGAYRDCMTDETLTAYDQTLRLSVRPSSYRILKRES